MKKIIAILVLSVVATAVQAQYVDDLYGTPVERARPAKVSRAERAPSTKRVVQDLTETYSQNNELISTLEEAIARRVQAYQSTAKHESSYWDVMEQYYTYLEQKYDQDLYNIIQVNDQMWVEPQHITALFDGSDAAAGMQKFVAKRPSPAEQNVTYNIYVEDSPAWDYQPFYGYGNPYWYGGWGIGWGYRGWSFGFGGWGNPYWGGYYPPYWGGGYPGYYPPYWGGGYPGYYGNGNVIYGNSHHGNRWPNSTGGGGVSPNLRPGTGSATGSVVGNSGYRRGGSGTYTPAFGGSGHTKNPVVTTPAYQPTYRPSEPDRTYRNNQPASRPDYRPTAPSSPSSSPSRPSGGSVGGGFGGGTGGGGHRR